MDNGGYPGFLSVTTFGPNHKGWNGVGFPHCHNWAILIEEHEEWGVSYVGGTFNGTRSRYCGVFFHHADADIWARPYVGFPQCHLYGKYDEITYLTIAISATARQGDKRTTVCGLFSAGNGTEESANNIVNGSFTKHHSPRQDDSEFCRFPMTGGPASSWLPGGYVGIYFSSIVADPWLHSMRGSSVLTIPGQ